MEEGGAEWPLRADDIARLVITETDERPAIYGDAKLVATRSQHVLVDILTPFPTTPFRRWRPLTVAGQHEHPLLTDPRGSRDYWAGRSVGLHTFSQSTWLPR